MNRFADIISRVLSVALYPLFIPTYGMILFCCAYSIHVLPLPLVWSLVAVIGTFLLTCLLPITAIWIMIRRGQVADIQIANANERTMPYIYTIFGFGCWAYLIISILKAPVFLGFVAVGATIAIGLIALINRFWKISAHLTGMGGIFGGLMSYCLTICATPTWGTIIGWLACSLVLMYARLRLDAHTPSQVCAGWLLGITSTFIPYCIFIYV